MRKRICKKKKILEGIAFCGVCGRALEVASFESKGKMLYEYSCRSGCIRAIRADALESMAWQYVRSVTSKETQEGLDVLLRDAEETRITREIIAVRQKVENVMDDLEVFKRRPEVIRMPDELIDWIDRPLPDRNEMIRQAEEEAREKYASSYSCEEYFSVAVPTVPEDNPEQARKAVNWYVERIMVHDISLEFTSTFDKWLAGKDFQRRERYRMTRCERKD